MKTPIRSDDRPVDAGERKTKSAVVMYGQSYLAFLNESITRRVRE